MCRTGPQLPKAEGGTQGRRGQAWAGLQPRMAMNRGLFMPAESSIWGQRTGVWAVRASDKGAFGWTDCGIFKREPCTESWRVCPDFRLKRGLWATAASFRAAVKAQFWPKPFGRRGWR